MGLIRPVLHGRCVGCQHDFSKGLCGGCGADAEYRYLLTVRHEVHLPEASANVSFEQLYLAERGANALIDAGAETAWVIDLGDCARRVYRIDRTDPNPGGD
jgi:hypothetical protein